MNDISILIMYPLGFHLELESYWIKLHVSTEELSAGWSDLGYN